MARALSGKAIIYGMAADIGSSLLSGSLLGALMAEQGTASLRIGELPAPVAAAAAAGIACTFLGGYVCATVAPDAKIKNAFVLGVAMTILAFVGAVLSFHVITPGQSADYVTAASIPFILPLTLLGGRFAQKRSRDKQMVTSTNAPSMSDLEDEWDWISESERHA